MVNMVGHGQKLFMVLWYTESDIGWVAFGVQCIE